MKNKLLIGLIATTLLTSMPINVYAVGSATINFTSKEEVFVDDTIKVYMAIEDVKDAHKGIVGVGGKLIFDNTKLEFIEAKTVDNPYDFWFNPKSNKLAGLDFTFEHAINKNTKIYEFTFKALEEGETSITLEEAELSDSKPSVLNTTVNEGKIKITTKPEIEETKEEKDITTNETPKIKEIVKDNIKKEEILTKEISNKEKLEQASKAIHQLLKKLSNIINR